MLLSDADYLKVLASSLSEDIMPDLQSGAARSLLACALYAVRELQNREALLPGLIDEVMPAGVALAGRMAGLLDRPVFDPVSVREDPGTRFRALLRALGQGAEALIARRGQMSPEQESAATGWLADVGVWEADYYRRFYAMPLPAILTQTSAAQLLTREKLQRLLTERLADERDVRVSAFEVVPGGFSNETYFFTLDSSKRSAEQLVIRKNSSSAILRYWGHLAREEYELLGPIADAGLPVPRPLWRFTDVPDVDGDFYVMTRGKGRMVGTLKGATEALPETLLFSLAEFLARLHAVPVDRFADYLSHGTMTVRVGDTVEQAVAKNVEFMYGQWKQAPRIPSANEAFTIDWLRRNVPANANPAAVVHADCYVHNFLVTDDAITTVVDWEATHFGDPAEDLAYIKDQVSLSMEWDCFLDHYRKSGGQPINQESFGYYKALLNFRNCLGTNLGAARIPRGYPDVRMLHLGAEYYSIFANACVDGARS